MSPSITLLRISDSKDCKSGKHSEPEHDPDNWTFELLSREKGVFYYGPDVVNGLVSDSRSISDKA